MACKDGEEGLCICEGEFGFERGAGGWEEVIIEVEEE